MRFASTYPFGFFGSELKRFLPPGQAPGNDRRSARYSIFKMVNHASLFLFLRYWRRNLRRLILLFEPARSARERLAVLGTFGCTHGFSPRFGYWSKRGPDGGTAAPGP